MGVKRITVDEIKNRCEKMGLTYISHYRKENSTKIYVRVICTCGNEFEPTLNNITTAIKNDKKFTCEKCGFARNGEAKKGKKASDEARQNMSEAQKKREPISNETRQKMSSSQKKAWSNERKQKHSERFSGEKNPMYSPKLTDEERENRRLDFGYDEWKIQVRKQANYTCDCCGKRGGKLNSHHLDDYHTHKELATDINNGVCLCKECHKEFHVKFMGGYRTPTTREDYLKFKQMKQNEKH